MGAVSSRMPQLWVSRGVGQPGAGGEEEEVDAAMAVVNEESEEAGPTTSHGGLKRKPGPTEPHAMQPPWKCARDSSGSIYEALFIRGENSDVQICALGEVWNLHKVYLRQSGYFASMFSGAWKESTMNTIDMQMPDENIDREAFHNVLSYLYRDSVLITPCRVVPILATASMLQVDGIIQQCGELMKENLSEETVCSYYHSAENYGLLTIKAMCFQWLLENLMTQRSEYLLRYISPYLMKRLVASSDLLVMEMEMDVYNKLKKWVFLQLQPTWKGPYRALLPEANLWLDKCKRESMGTPFLETEQGRVFMPVFQQLRLAYIICDLSSARTIDQDALIPATWLNPVYKEQWLALLQAEQNRKLRPCNLKVLSVPEDSMHCMRCGAQIRRDERCSWRWTGFNFGWDLVVTYSNRRIVFERGVVNKTSLLGVNQLWHKNIAFRLFLTSLDESGRAIFKLDTGYQMLSFKKDQVLEIVNLENQDVVFPVYVSCNFLYLQREGHCP